MQQPAVEQRNFYAGRQEFRVIRARCPAHQKGIHFFGQYQHHVHTALGSSGERGQQQLVRYKIRRGDGYPCFGGMDGTHDGFVNHGVGLVGRRRYYLCHGVARLAFQGQKLRYFVVQFLDFLPHFRQMLVRLHRHVGIKHRRHFQHHRAAAAHHHVHPFAHARILFEMARVD